MVVLTTSETTTSGMLAVLSYTTVTGRDVAAVLAGLREAGRHGVCRERNDQNQHPISVSTLHPGPPGPIQPRIQYFGLEKLGERDLGGFCDGATWIPEQQGDALTLRVVGRRLLCESLEMRFSVPWKTLQLTPNPSREAPERVFGSGFGGFALVWQWLWV